MDFQDKLNEFEQLKQEEFEKIQEKNSKERSLVFTSYSDYQTNLKVNMRHNRKFVYEYFDDLIKFGVQANLISQITINDVKNTSIVEIYGVC
jgi:hypothetical protein